MANVKSSASDKAIASVEAIAKKAAKKAAELKAATQAAGKRFMDLGTPNTQKALPPAKEPIGLLPAAPADEPRVFIVGAEVVVCHPNRKLHSNPAVVVNDRFVYWIPFNNRLYAQVGSTPAGSKLNQAWMLDPVLTGIGFGAPKASVVVKSVKKVAPSVSMRNKIAKSSRKAQHRLAAIARRARQAKNGWLRSPAYQLMCREADHASRVSQTTPPSGGVKAGSSSNSVIKYSRLSDGDGVFGLTPAVRVHKTFVAPVTRREQHLAAREQLKAAGLLPNQAPALGKALKEQRKAKAKAKSLAASPVARPRDINRAAAQLEKAAAKAARLAEAVKASANKKKEQRIDNSIQEVVTTDDFLTQLEFLRTQLDANLAPTVPQDFAAAAAEIVAERKVRAEATGTDGMTMLMSMSTIKDEGGNEVNVLNVGGTWSGKQIDPLLKTATKNVMVNLVGKNNLQKAEFTKRSFVLVADEWYCLPLADNKQLIKETPVRPPIVSRALLNPPKLVVRERADGSKYLHLFSNVATAKNIKALLAEPKELEVLVNISPEQLVVENRDKFVEFLRANGFESYSTHTNWLVLPAGKLFAEPKAAAAKVAASLSPWSFDTYLGQEDGLQLSITVNHQKLEAVLTITDDEADSYAQAEKLGVLDSLKPEVLRSLEGAVKDVHYLYDTRTSPVLHDLLNNLGFVKYSDTSDGWLVKRATKLSEVVKPIMTKEVKPMYITVHSKSKTKTSDAVGFFTVGGTTIPVEVDQAATEPANRLLCVKQAIAYAVNSRAKAVSIEYTFGQYDLNSLAKWKAAGWKVSNVDLLKAIDELASSVQVTWVNSKNKGVEEVVNTVETRTVAQAQVTEVQSTATASHQVIGGEAYAEDGLKHYRNYLVPDVQRYLWDEITAILDEPTTNKTSFQTNGYQYTCLGDYYWVWNKGKADYLTTQPDGSAIKAMPGFLKKMAEHIVNHELAGIFNGQFVAESCLVNVYQSGNVLNYHVDKTEEVDAPIVSLSLGANGNFNIKNKDNSVRQFTLNKGDLFVFYGKQRYCVHSYAGNIEEGTRINLTFRMVKKPALKQEEVRTVSQNKRTVSTAVAENKAVEQEQTARTLTRDKTNKYFKPQPKARTLPVPELLPQSEVGRITSTPEGCSHVFDFRTSEAKTGLSEVIVAAFSVMINPATGDLVECNINTPSPAYNDDYVHYGLEDVLTTKKGEDMNVLSLIAPATKSLAKDKTPCVLSVSKHCTNGVREEFVPTAYSSVGRIEKEANIQIVLVQPGGESALTKENSVPGVETEARQELRGAILEGESKTIYSALYKDEKDEVGTETSVTTSFFLAEGLKTLLADGRRHIFIVAAWFDKDKHQYFTKGGKQYRIYPHTASVFHVDDQAKVFGGTMFKFDVRAMLGLAAAPTIKAKTATEVKVEREKLDAKTPITLVEETVATEVQDSIARTNLAKELADLYKHTRLRGQPLSKGLTLDEVKRLRKNIGGDGLVAHRTLSYIKSRTDDKPVQLFDWTKADVLKVAELFFGLMPTDKATADKQVFCYREVEEGLLLSFDGGTIEFLIGNDGRAYNAQDGRAFEQGMELIGYNKQETNRQLWELAKSWYPRFNCSEVLFLNALFFELATDSNLTGHEEIAKIVLHKDGGLSNLHLINGRLETRDVNIPVIEDVCFASSIGKFMQAFCAYLLMFAQSKNNHRQGLANNFRILLNECESVFSLTEGEILSQNGGFLYSVQNSPKLFVHKTQNDIFGLEDSKLKDLAKSVAVYVRGYNIKPPAEMLKVSSTDTQSLAMKIAFKKYPALGFHFAKGTFINGLTHIRLATLQKYAPTLFKKTLVLTGLDVQKALDSVVSLTLKASKGAKRATLALARAVEVEGEVKAGWAFYGQEKVLTGWLVQECMAPTFVMAPGMSFFLGNESEKPVALVRKTQTERFNKFLSSNLEGAVSMTGVTERMKCLADYKPTKTYDEASATHRITFDKEVKLLEGTQIAYVKREEGPDAIITFNQNEVAFLNDITWTVHKGLVGEPVLVVNYSYTLHHRNPKLRGVIKTMMASCKKELLYNWFNNQKLEALGLNDIKLVAPQDTIKSDMLYSWLMVIGNTIRHNGPTNLHIAQLIKLRNQLNQEMMGGADYDTDTVIINPAAVVAGLYSELISYFNQHFGHALWMHVQQPGDQGEIMNRLYVDRVAQNAGWVDVPETAWGEYEQAWAVSRREQGYTVKLYAESADYLKNDKQNALLFTLDADGVVVEYLHRSFCFVGAEGAPVYGVELFESSTVAEAISDSRHIPSSVRSLSRMEGVAFDDAWALLNAGKEKMFMSLVIAGMSSKDKFNRSKTVTILERGAKKDKNLVLSAEDKDYLNGILAQNSINLDYYEDEQFKSVAHAFRDIVFVAKGKSYWLPALFAINKLKSESSTNNLAQQFFRDILVECLAGRNVPAIESSRAAGILDSLCDSASTKKLITAAGNMSAKRIALPHIPAGEIHILKSTHPASNYQNLLRNGFKLKEVEAGKSTIFVHNSRAPLTDGSLLKLVIVTEAENNDNFYKLDSDSFALGGMGNGMDFGDFDGDGHYFVQLVGTDYKVSTFESVADFITDAVGYNIFNTYANPTNTKEEPNEAYLADHYNIKKWSKVDETLCNMGVKKATKSAATYLMYNQNAREMQAKATGIAYSVYMWSEHLVDILLAYKKLGGALPLGFDAAADGSLVAPISQVYEVILGGFSDPAWKVYTKYFLKMKEGDRTVFDHNLAEFNRDLMAMGVTGQKQAGFSALMFASYHLFFLEKWGAFNDYEADSVTKNPLPSELKGMLACALVSFELMRGKFQGFTGSLAVEKGGKVTGHKTAMNFARNFLLNNPGMVAESLVCKQLAQTIEVCNHLLEGKPRAERSLGTPGVIQERTVIVPTSNLSEEALQHFLTKVGALAEVKVDDSDEGGSKVAIEPNTPDSGEGGVAVEAMDYDAYLATEEVVVEPVEEAVYASSTVVDEYYTESELEKIAVQEELEFAVSTTVITTSQQEDQECLVLSLKEERALKDFNPELEDLDILGLEKLVPEYISNKVLEYVESEEEHKACLVHYLEANGYEATPVKLILQEKLEKLLSDREENVLDTFVSRLDIDVETDEFTEESDQEEFVAQLSAHLANPDWEGFYTDGDIAVYVKTVLDSIDPPVAAVEPPADFVEYVKSNLEPAVSEKPIEVTAEQAEQVEQPVQSEVIENRTKEKMATLMQAVEQLPESALDKLLAEGERLLAEHNKTKKPVREVKAVEPLKEAEPVTTLDNKSLVEVVHVKKVVGAIPGYRASLIGNPFELGDKNNAQERAVRINCFKDYFTRVVYFGEEPIEVVASTLKAFPGVTVADAWKKPSRKAFIDSLLAIWDVVEAKGAAKVGCWCAPLACHLDVVKADFEKAGSKAAWVAGVYQVKEVEVVAEPADGECPDVPKPSSTPKVSLTVSSRDNKTTNSSSREILQSAAVVEEVKTEVVKAHPLDGLAPLTAFTAEPMIKDIAMAAVATQFIGTSAVSKPSSTELYRQAWADWKGGCANTGVYSAEDVVMVSGNGSYRATEAQIAQTFTKSYVPYLALVVSAKATVVVGDCSGMDCLVRDYLVEAGYQKTWVAAEVRGYNKLTPPSKPKREVLSKESIKQPVKTTVVQPEGDWVEALVSPLEPWTGNQIKKALATLSSEQLEAARIIIQHSQGNTTAKVAELDPKDVVGGHILTGKAGTGKSYTADVIIQVLDLLGFRVVACGTTGLASQNLDGSSGTINRVLNLLDGFDRKKDANGKLLPLTQADISGIVTRMVKGGKVAKRLSEQSDNKNYVGVILLVDEAFMLGGHLAIAAAAGIEAIAATEAQKGVVRKRPVQLLLVGDPKQFEPVKDVLLCEETQFLENASDEQPVAHPSFTDYMNLKTIKLLKNERQSGDSPFGDELDLLGEGKAAKDLSNCPIIKRRFKESLTNQPADALHIIFNKEETALFNKQKLEELVKRTRAVKKVYKAVINKGKYESVEKLLSDISPTPEFLELVVGVPVKVTQNIPKNDGTDDNRVANGERGIVTHLSKDKVTVRFNDGRFEELEAVELDKKLSKDENGAPMGEFKQIPLCLCWATTFHGSQGQTYPKGEPVIVHMYSRQNPRDPQSELRPVPANNAFYVACSRVTRSEDLFFYTGLGVDVKPEDLTDEQFVDYRRNTYLGRFKASYKYNQAALAWLDKQSC